jgi:SprT protein
MMLTQAQKQQILDKINACYDTCDAHYNRTFKRPTTRFDLTGTTAGTADPRGHVLRFQPVLAAGHWDDFLNNTVPHEVAHLVDYDVNNKLEAQMQARMAAIQNQAIFGNWGRRARRPKRDIHGDSWRAVMRVLGINYAARCHQYDTSQVARRKARHEYRCTCGETLSVGPKHHNAILRGARITHKTCRTVITSAMLVGKVARAPVAVAAQVPTPKAPVAPGAGTKMQQAIAIVNANATLGPAGTIALIMRELGMSKAGAQTYYYSARKQR